jgi:predicted transcriptional regulator
MARFKRDKAEARSEMISFRAAPSEIEYLQELAHERGLSLANLLREAIDDYIKRQQRRPKATQPKEMP